MFKTNHKNHRAARTVRAMRAFGRRVLGIRFRRYLPYTSVPVLLDLAAQLEVELLEQSTVARAGE